MEKEFKLSNEQYDLISSVHNTIQGHHGVERTMDKLINLGKKWEFMREHIRFFIKKKCPCCQLMSNIKIPIHTTPFTIATYEPMEKLAVDTIGPVPIDEEGNAYIIVLIDCHTRFVGLYAAKDTTAKSAAKAIIHHLGLFGCPRTLLSDNGSQYVNSLISEILRIMGIESTLTIAYSHEQNGIIERANKEIMRHLKNMIFEKNIHYEWHLYLPLVQRIINSSVNSSIGVAPAQLLFGKAINLDRGLFFFIRVCYSESRHSTTFILL
jgi:transposase InsO family protein